MSNQEIPILSFDNQKAWRQWLQNNHTSDIGIWMKFAKKNSGVASVNYTEALDVALCYGWIDGLVKRLDETYYIQKFTPRRKRSLWSKRNIEHVKRLTAAGLMMPPGIAEVERAKNDGRWNAAYDAPSTIVVPQSFLDELEKQPKAKAFYETLNKSDKYAIAWQLQTAKKEETRFRRQTKIIAILETKQKP